jgi:ATP-binding cassette subfamily B (MDR/TAP) protein 1
LRDINIKVLKNKVNALVGESGSGKSTISQLLMRYYDPLNGSVLINDTPLNEININNFRRKIGYVGQEPVLFAMSIEENIKLANPELTQSQIIEILKKANAWEFVEKL